MQTSTHAKETKPHRISAYLYRTRTPTVIQKSMLYRSSDGIKQLSNRIPHNQMTFIAGAHNTNKTVRMSDLYSRFSWCYFHILWQPVLFSRAYFCIDDL